MKQGELETVVRELAALDVAKKPGYAIHGKLAGALQDPKTRPLVRAALSRGLDRTPCATVAFYAAMHALEDGDLDAFRALARHPDEKVRHGAVNGSYGSSTIRDEAHHAARPFIVEALNDVSPKVRAEACRAFDARGVAKNAVLPIERFCALLNDGHADVRREAVWLVGRLGKAKRIDLAPFLPRLLERLDDQDIYVHEGVTRSCKRIWHLGSKLPAPLT